MWITLLASILCLHWPPLATAAPAPTVGMEGRVEVTLPGPQLEAKPVDQKSLIVLRIADTRPHGTLIHYDLRFVGLEPGNYDLGDYLVRADGLPSSETVDIPVQIAPLLPEQHDGLLTPPQIKRFPFLGGYQVLMIVVGVLWVLTLAGLMFYGRRKVAVPSSATVTAPPTLAERLRPLVEQAAAGKLPPQGQAQLERLLLTHWRRELKIDDDEDMMIAIGRLREHPEAGALLRQLEDWLHRPAGAVEVDINKLLEPYTP